MKTQHEFFNVMPVDEALALLQSHCVAGHRRVRMAVADAVGRVLTEDVRSPTDLPNFIRSTMDGYAVRAGDTYGASEGLPAYLNLVGVVQMGEVPSIRLGMGEAVEIHTGAMLPEGADAVVMVERTQKINDDEIEVLAPVAQGEHLVQIGEDVREGAIILGQGHRLRPQDIGGLLAVGVTTVEVAERVRVGVLSCGDELVEPNVTPDMGQIRDINAYVLGAMFAQAGADVLRAGIARDSFDALHGLASATLAECDMLVLTAGSSVSVRDLTREVIEALGEPGVLQHGLAVKPGKPALLAVVDGKPVIGLPGNPVSAMLVARQIVLPMLRYLVGEVGERVASTEAILGQNIASTTGREDSVPVKLERGADGVLYAMPVFGKSNLIYTLIKADGLVTVHLNQGGIRAGEKVRVTLF